jgi:hypothetical protein
VRGKPGLILRKTYTHTLHVNHIREIPERRSDPIFSDILSLKTWVPSIAIGPWRTLAGNEIFQIRWESPGTVQGNNHSRLVQGVKRHRDRYEKYDPGKTVCVLLETYLLENFTYPFFLYPLLHNIKGKPDVPDLAVVLGMVLFGKDACGHRLCIS